MKHILFISYHYWPPDFSGEIMHTVERFDYLKKKGNKINVLTRGIGGYPQIEKNKNLKITRTYDFGGKKWQKALNRLYFSVFIFGHLLIKKYDWILYGSSPFPRHLGFLLFSIINLLTKWRNIRTSYILSLADKGNSALNISGIRNMSKRWFFRSIDKIVCVSPKIFDDVKCLYPNKAVLILNRIHTDLFYPETNTKSIWKRKFNIQNGEIIFLSVGSISYRKGSDILIRAFNKLAWDYSNWYLLFLGPKNEKENPNVSNEEYGEIMNLAAENNQIKFLGKEDDRVAMRHYFNASDILVFPSRREGFGYVPGEAMACGIPVIQSKIQGITDLMTIEGETGYYTKDPEDVEELSFFMEKLGTNHSLRIRMGQNGMKRIQTHFNWDAHIKEWNDFFNS